MVTSHVCLPLVVTAIKASVLSAHDKGSHAVVLVKVRKVLRSGKVSVSQGTHSIYPLSWTSRGCTCPILNPGKSLFFLECSPIVCLEAAEIFAG